LRREISTAALDLWHVKGIIRALADGKAKIGGVDLKDEEYLVELMVETESLYERVNKTKQEVKTLIGMGMATALYVFAVKGWLK